MNMRENFLQNSENKEDLNRYLANKFMSLDLGSRAMVVTFGNSILTNDDSLLLEERINYCTSEEADARLVRHTIHCIEKGYNSIVVRTIDTDVVVLLISCKPYMDEVGTGNVYALMGKGKDLHYYDINAISSKLGTDMCEGLPFFYAFTGCDTVSSMFNVSKCTFWDNLNLQKNLPDLLEIFKELSKQPLSLTSRQINLLELFVLRVYYPKNPSPKGLNEERLAHFKRQAVTNLRGLPFSKSGLAEHSKRA